MSNQAAWISSRGAPVEVKESPYPSLKPGHIIVKNKAVAINPIDWKMRDLGILVRSWPTILGTDVAGEVVAVAADVSGFAPGQRVIGFACGLASGDPDDAAFQLYACVPANMATPIPDSMSFREGVVLPVTFACAAAGLYEGYALGLPLPRRDPVALGKTILIWGGSSSVGSCAIQLARASGLEVVATASERNFGYVRKLGAAVVLDYAASDVVDRLVDLLKDKNCVGAFDAVGMSIRQCAEVLSRIGGGRVVGTADPPQDLPAGVTGCHVFATTIKENDIGKDVWQGYLTDALADGRFIPSPKPTVIGHGLESIQMGIDKVKEGVSATKLVITL